MAPSNSLVNRHKILSFGILITFLLTSLESSAKGLDERLNDAFMPIAQGWENMVLFQVSIGGVEVPFVLILLLGGALFFTVYFGFVNITKFPLALRIVRGKYDHLEKEEDDVRSIVSNRESVEPPAKAAGEINHFQALATAMSGTVGLGNIAMVAVAVSIGGPGATFWMIVAGLLGMSSKFVECTLGVKYRDVGKDGSIFGGPMYYLSKGLKERKMKGLGKVLAGLFAILCVGASFGGGNAFQSNQAAAQIIGTFDLEGSATGTLIGVIFAVLVGIVVIGGIKRIAKVTEKLVPGMTALYVLAALLVLIMNFSFLDDAFSLIWNEAFTPRAGVTGGVLGVMILGFRRAAFSNEAGVGSAAIAHSAASTRYPASEGLVALLEPFIDTVVICTMTALVIITFNLQDVFVYGDVINNEVALTATGERIGGVNITSLAFDSSVPGFSYLLVIAVVLFAFSTMLSWFYYGAQAWKFLFGRGKGADLIFKVIFLLFTILGAGVTLDAVLKFSDAMILALVFPNMIGLLLLFPKVRGELTRYLKKIKSSLSS